MVKDSKKDNIIKELQEKICNCSNGNSTYLTDQQGSMLSDSSSNTNSVENSFIVQPPICTFNILTPETSRCTSGESPSASINYTENSAFQWPTSSQHVNDATNSESSSLFKPLSLPKFQKGGNMHTFLKIFDNSMHSATDKDKAIIVINCLDSNGIELVMPWLPANDWTYFKARAAIIAEFSSEVYIASKKDVFMHIEVQEDETIEAFADQFYLESQILIGCSALITFVAKIALKYTIKPFN